MRVKCVGLTLALGLTAAFTVEAQDHPNLAKGFSAPTTYQSSGLDTINTFNGSLTVRLPLGPEFPAGGNLSYQFVAYSNDDIWRRDVDEYPEQTFVNYYVEEGYNAGVGWKISFGELAPPYEPGVNDTALWQLIEPDGSRHRFYEKLHLEDPEDSVGNVYYTRDGTYMRLEEAGANGPWTVQSGDGTSREFTQTVDWGIRPTRIYDPYGNEITITYDANSWEVSDAYRTHVLEFEASVLGKRASVLKLSSFGADHLSGTAEIAFAYEENVVIGVPNDGANGTVAVDFLTSVTLPAGAGAYGMEYYKPSGPPGPVVTDCPSDVGNGEASGAIHRLALPTGGVIGWEYRPYYIGESNGYPLIKNGVECRMTYEDHPPAPPETLTHYRHATVTDQGWCLVGEACPGNPLTTEIANVVEDLLGRRTVNYFTLDTDEWDHGLPMSRGYTSGGVRLSRQVYPAAASTPIRSFYVNYDKDSEENPQGFDAIKARNQRVSGQRTVYHDDEVSQGVEALSTTTYSDFDGLGHYRTMTTGGNFSSGNVRTVTTQYEHLCSGCTRGSYPGPSFNPLPADQPWLPNAYTQRTVTESGAGTSTSKYCFNAGTGVLNGKRTLSSRAGSTNGANDVLMVYSYDTKGQLQSEQLFGGDQQSLAPSALCTAPSVHAVQRVDHTYEFGVRKTSDVIDDCDGSSLLRTLDQTIDVTSGLVSSNRDSAGVQTTYLYDALGRMKRSDPAATDATVYDYNPVATPPNVTISRGGIVATLEYDGLGRLDRELEDTPTGRRQRSFFYDEVGRKKEESVWKSGGTTTNPSPLRTVFQYDTFDRVTSTTTPDNKTTIIDYDGVRQVTRTIQDVGGSASTTTELYDRQGRLTQVCEPSKSGACAPTTYGYDEADRLTSVLINGSQSRSFVYDGRGFLSSEKHPEIGTSGNGTLSYSKYDALGNVGEQIITGGPALEYVYDHAGRLTQVLNDRVGVNDDKRVIKELFYGRSNSGSNRTLGKLVRQKRHNWVPINGVDTDYTITEDFEYMGLDGRLSRVRMRSNHGMSAETWVEYDSLGLMKDIHYPVCDRPPCGAVGPSRHIEHTFEEGYLTSVRELDTGGQIKNQLASAITYHPSGLIASLTHGNTVVDSQTNDSSGLARPGSITFQALGSPALWSSGSYVYDGAGNIKSIGSNIYQYDRVSRLTNGSVVVPNGPNKTQALTYDLFGNILTMVTDSEQASIGVDAATNRLTSGGASATYDAAGNVTGWKQSTYVYDPLNRMTVHTGTGVSQVFVYNGDDERVLVVDKMAEKETWTIRGANDKALREFEVVGGVPSWSKDYVYRGAALVASLGPGGGGAELERHYHLDHLGNTRFVTDENQGVVAEKHFYPFGQLAYSAGNEKFLFTGHERDFNCENCQEPDEDDLDYMLARHYAPGLGRFLSVDPVQGSIANPQSWNGFSYVESNPTAFRDPDGEVLDYALDAVGIAYDIYEIRRDGLNWKNGLVLAADVVLAAAPVLPTIGGVKAAGKTAGAAVDLATTANRVDNFADSGRAANAAADGVSRARFEVTPKGTAVPTSPAELRQNMSHLQDASTSPSTSRKFVGRDSQGPVRVRIEKAHPSDPNFTGTPDPLHTVDHLHIDRRKKVETGAWKSDEKISYDWPFD